MSVPSLLVLVLLQTTVQTTEAHAAPERTPSGDVKPGDIDGPADQDDDHADLIEDEPQPDAPPAPPAPAAAATPTPPDGGPPQRVLELDDETARLMWHAGMVSTALSVVAIVLTPIGTIVVAVIGGLGVNAIGDERTDLIGTPWTLVASSVSPWVAMGSALVGTTVGLIGSSMVYAALGLDYESAPLLPADGILWSAVAGFGVGLAAGVAGGGYLPVLAYEWSARPEGE